MSTLSTAKRKFDWLWTLALIAVAVFPIVYPGFTPFMSDEPLILRAAYDANAAHRLADAGLIGTHGFRYGPLPIWIYQAILAITHNPILIVVIHTALFSASLVLALAWFGRAMKLWKWGALALAMSPHVWFYSRQLWDNTFNISLGALCIASYAAFLVERKWWQVMIAVFTAGMMVLVHLMAVVMPAALLVHLIFFRWRDFKRFWTNVVIALLLVGGASVGYGWNVSHDISRANMLVTPAISRWWFALLGPRALSAAWMDYFFPAPWLTSAGSWSTAYLVFSGISWLAFPLTWFGLLLGVRSLLRRQIHPQDSSKVELAGLCCIAVIFQILLNGFTVTYGHPHYYGGTWGIFAAAMWIGLDRIARFNTGRAVGWIQTIAVTVICILLLSRIIHTGGTRDLHFGPTMANQVQLLDAWSRYSEDSPMHLDVQMNPNSLRMLDLLNPHIRNGTEPRKVLAVKYVSDDPSDGRVKLVEDRTSP